MDTCKQPVQQMKIHERIMTFGGENDGGLGDLLIQQVLDGVKTATCDLRCFCTQQEIADLGATPGWMETVVESAGNPRCDIRVIAVYETSSGIPILAWSKVKETATMSRNLSTTTNDAFQTY